MSKSLRWARIGLICSQSQGHAGYVRELLSHAGFAYQEINTDELTEQIKTFAIIIISGNMSFDSSEAAAFANHISNGATIIALGDCSGIEHLFGVKKEHPHLDFGLSRRTLGEGYVRINGEHPITKDVTLPLHFWGGTPVNAMEDAQALAVILDLHQNDLNYSAITVRTLGLGTTIFFAFDLLCSIIRMQQGKYIDHDGVPAPDGSAPIDDGKLRTEDGIALDWIFDREKLSEGEFPIFARPQADIMKELLIKAIIWTAQKNDFAIPITWYYPRNLNALGLVTIDTNENDQVAAQAMIHALRMIGVRATWCIQYPGYPLDLYRTLRTQDHEVALRFDATERNSWNEERFKIQLTHLHRVSGSISQINKNHDSRWEGRNKFYSWCDRNGVGLDLSKGPSIIGTGGFPFGTCHPYHPVDDDGMTYKCFELPYTAQDPGEFMPVSASYELLETVLSHNGIAQFSINSTYLDEVESLDNLRKLAALARSKKMEWWKADDILQWERSRRRLHILPRDGATGIFLGVLAEDEMEDVTFLFLTPHPMSISVRGKPVQTLPITRFGFEFQSVTLRLASRTPAEIYLQ